MTREIEKARSRTKSRRRALIEALLRESVIGTTGDASPFEYGGGVVVGGDYEPTWWVWHGMDEMDGVDYDTEVGDVEFEVYRISVPEGVFDEYDWIDVDDVARTSGLDADELRARGVSPDVMDRVSAIEDATRHYGYYEFDQYPETMSAADIRRYTGLE